MKEYIPFTYLIGWSKLNKFYYGCKCSKGTTPDVLWKTYFTSSKYVYEMREKYGEPDIIEVRRTFKTKDECYLWETRVLTKLLSSKNKEKWINRARGGLYGYRCLTEESRKKMREAKLGKKQNPEMVKKRTEAMLKTRKERDNYKVSEETKKKISLKTSEGMRKSGFVYSEEEREIMRKASKGRRFGTEEARNAMKEAMKEVHRLRKERISKERQSI